MSEIDRVAYLAGQVAALKMAVMSLMKTHPDPELLECQLRMLSLKSSVIAESGKAKEDYLAGQMAETDDLHNVALAYLAERKRTK